MLNNKSKGLQKGAFQKLAKRLKELGQRPPPNGLMEILNQTEKPNSVKDKKIATSKELKNDLDM